MATITHKGYAEAVQNLLKIATGDTGGARASALVLLSAYNSDDFRLPIAELGCLDPQRYADAIAVIRCRVELGIEPHEVIADGGRKFEALWQTWRNEMHRPGTGE